MRELTQTNAARHALLGLAGLAFGLSAVPAMGQNPLTDVMRVEEDWEAVLTDPVQDLTAPQFHTVMSPFGHLDSYHFMSTWNYRESPDFTSGGLMTHAWDGESQLTGKQWREDPLSNAAETIRWTQSMRSTGSQLIFRVFNGQSTTWGSFGGSDTRLVMNLPVESLSGYSTSATLAESWITYGANRVNLLRITEVRYYDVHYNLLYKDTTPKIVYQQSE